MGHGLALESEAAEDAFLELGRRRRIGADRSRQRADGGLRERPLETPGIAVGLERKPRELYPERGGLGVDPVRAPDAQRVDVFARLGRERLDEAARIGQHQLADAAKLQRQTGVEHVARCQPVVNPASRRAGRRREYVDEGGGVVVGQALALLDRLNRERRTPDRLELGFGRTLELLASGYLDFAHRVEARMVRPDLAQFGPGVTLNHGC